MPLSERKFVRIQEKGQVTLPAEVRRNLGLKKGDVVAVEETPDGVLITPQRVVPASVLDRIGKTLAEQGISMADIRAWASAGQTPEGIPLRDYTPEQVRQFLADDARVLEGAVAETDAALEATWPKDQPLSARYIPRRIDSGPVRNVLEAHRAQLKSIGALAEDDDSWPYVPKSQ